MRAPPQHFKNAETGDACQDIIDARGVLDQFNH
jgi:hypothetical protein